MKQQEQQVKNKTRFFSLKLVFKFDKQVDGK
jgi:hypothetical protein